MKSYRRQKSSTNGNNGSFWLSFSDMMSVLVLIFIFVIFSMMYTLKKAQDDYVQAHNEYEIALAQLEAKNQENANLLILVSDYKTKLNDKEEELASANDQLIVIMGEKENLQTALDEKDTIVVDLRAQAQRDSDEIIRLQNYSSQLEQTNTSLISQNKSYVSQLSDAQNRLRDAQAQLAAILGVKGEIITDLSNEFRRNGEIMGIDENTGALTLSSSTLFPKGNAVLSDAGKSTLDRYLKIYLNVLLSEKYRGYVAEIIIEGHTDSSPRGEMTGEYEYLGNLGLSLDRAEAVANYILDPYYMRYTLGLNDDKVKYFKSLVTTSGRSSSDLIMVNKDEEDSDASRRVVIKFRLVDADSIEATKGLIQ